MKNKALITGISGQDGSYLAEFLLNKGYEVHGIVKKDCPLKTTNIEHIITKLSLHHCDITDRPTLEKILKAIVPDEVYNLAAQSHVQVSFEKPEYTEEVNTVGVFNLLETINNTPKLKNIRFYQASTSEMYGNSKQSPQNENTPFNPCSPYGKAKLFAHKTVQNYRSTYGMHASCGILFNHESPRRGETFVSRKITLAAANIKTGSQNTLFIGNLDAKRDWGYAPDYVEAMWLILQQERPDDYVISTGENHTVREFVEKVFQKLDMNIIWQGQGEKEIGVTSDNRTVIQVDPRFFRPTEVNSLKGDHSKAKNTFNWKPTILFSELVDIMCAQENTKK
ncbi:GDP-mannose 4,6-dehydratase [Candidatus Margulisiibacteriota bacterium]